MTRFGWTLALSLLILCILCGTFLAWHSLNASRAETAPVATAETPRATPLVDPSALSIFTSGEYGFSFFYPAGAEVLDTFSTSSDAAHAWRVHAVGTGTPVVRIDAAGGMLQVGVSADAEALEACTEAAPAEEPLGPFTIGSIEWQAFSFTKLGTDNEQKVTSYRTLHGDTCIAFEVFTPYPETPLPAGYSISDSITSFTFAN